MKSSFYKLLCCFTAWMKAENVQECVLWRLSLLSLKVRQICLSGHPWAHTHTRPPRVELLSFQPRYSLKKGLFTTSKPKSIHWNVNMHSSSDAQTRGSRVSCLYALTGFFFASTVYKKRGRKSYWKARKASTNTEGYLRHYTAYRVQHETKMSLGTSIIN